MPDDEQFDAALERVRHDQLIQSKIDELMQVLLPERGQMPDDNVVQLRNIDEDDWELSPDADERFGERTLKKPTFWITLPWGKQLHNKNILFLRENEGGRLDAIVSHLYSAKWLDKWADDKGNLHEPILPSALEVFSFKYTVSLGGRSRVRFEMDECSVTRIDDLNVEEVRQFAGNMIGADSYTRRTGDI